MTQLVKTNIARPDPQWDDLKTILSLVRHGSLAGAAAELGVNYTTVSRRITRAEEALGQVLFERLADGYRPTEQARLIADHAERMEGETDAMMRQIHGLDQRLTGQLVVTAPQLLIVHVLAPLLQDFADRHPGVQLKLRASNELLDLNRREADLAIRISRSPGDTLMGRRLVGQKTGAFASDAYADELAAAPPGTPVNWLAYEAMTELPAHVRKHHPEARMYMVFDDMVAMAGAAAAGLGVVRMPLFLGRAMGLRQVDLLPAQSYPDLWMVAHTDLWRSAKVAAFREMLVPFIKAEAHRFT